MRLGGYATAPAQTEPPAPDGQAWSGSTCAPCSCMRPPQRKHTDALAAAVCVVREEGAGEASAAVQEYNGALGVLWWQQLEVMRLAIRLEPPRREAFVGLRIEQRTRPGRRRLGRWRRCGRGRRRVAPRSLLRRGSQGQQHRHRRRQRGRHGWVGRLGRRDCYCVVVLLHTCTQACNHTSKGGSASLARRAHTGRWQRRRRRQLQARQLRALASARAALTDLRAGCPLRGTRDGVGHSPAGGSAPQWAAFSTSLFRRASHQPQRSAAGEHAASRGHNARLSGGAARRAAQARGRASPPVVAAAGLCSPARWTS